MFWCGWSAEVFVQFDELAPNIIGVDVLLFLQSVHLYPALFVALVLVCIVVPLLVAVDRVEAAHTSEYPSFLDEFLPSRYLLVSIALHMLFLLLLAVRDEETAAASLICVFDGLGGRHQAVVLVCALRVLLVRLEVLLEHDGRAAATFDSIGMHLHGRRI